MSDNLGTVAGSTFNFRVTTSAASRHGRKRLHTFSYSPTATGGCAKLR